MLNFNLETLAIQVHDAVTSMLRFLRGLTTEEREDTKLVSLLDVPPHCSISAKEFNHTGENNAVNWT
jgi:hypothetical protein